MNCIRIGQLARLFGRERSTIRRWERKGTKRHVTARKWGLASAPNQHALEIPEARHGQQALPWGLKVDINRQCRISKIVCWHSLVEPALCQPCDAKLGELSGITITRINSIL